MTTIQITGVHSDCIVLRTALDNGNCSVVTRQHGGFWLQYDTEFEAREAMDNAEPSLEDADGDYSVAADSISYENAIAEILI